MTLPTIESLSALAQDPPHNKDERHLLFEAARQLMFSVEDEMNMGFRVFYNLTSAATAQAAIDLRIFEILAENEEKHWTAAELSREIGADSQLTDRLMRSLAVNNLAKEVADSTYAASHLSKRCADPAFSAGLQHSKNLIWPGFQALPSFLAANGYQNPSDAKNCASIKGLGFDGDIHDYMNAHPEKAKASYQFMVHNKKNASTWIGSTSVPGLNPDAADLSSDRILWVDVGGGSGHQSVLVSKMFPALHGRMIVQDLDMMIGQIDEIAAVEAGFSPMVHDFFSPQPVKGAKIYYMRNVLHDWDDARCSAILLHLREALVADSIILLDEIVLPLRNATARQVHMDLTMMVFAGAMERTEKQWSDLVASAGLKVKHIEIYDEQLRAGLISVALT